MRGFRMIGTRRNVYAPSGGRRKAATRGPAAAEPLECRRLLSASAADAAPVWTDRDIGSPAFAGSSQSVMYVGLVVTAGGRGVGGASDQCHFFSQQLTGDGCVEGTPFVLSQQSADGAQVAMMFRADDSPGAPFAAIVQTSSADRISFEWRAAAGAEAQSISAPLPDRTWATVELVRSGQTFTAWYQTWEHTSNGDERTEYQRLGDPQTVPMPATASAGVAVAAGDNSRKVSVPVGVDVESSAVTAHQIYINRGDYEEVPLNQPLTYACNVELMHRGDALVYDWSVELYGQPYALPAGTTNGPVFTFTPRESGDYTIHVRVQDAPWGVTEDESHLYAAPVGAPSPPYDLYADGISASDVDLTWRDGSDDQNSFTLERATNSTFTRDAHYISIPGNKTHYIDGGLAPQKTYYYRLAANNAAGSSPYTSFGWADDAWAVSATTLKPLPAAPSDVTATADGPGELSVAWQDNSNNEDGFEVDISPDGGESWLLAATPGRNATSATLSHLLASTAYRVRVLAWNEGGGASRAAESAGPAITPPQAPPDSELSTAQTTLSLSVPVGLAPPGTGYVYRWDVLAEPSSAPDPCFSENGDTTSDRVTARFYQAGTYILQVYASNESSYALAILRVRVSPTLTTILVTPGEGSTNAATTGGGYQLHALALDQFGNPMPDQPASFDWNVTSGPGAVSAAGLLRATGSAGTITVAASSQGVTSGASVFAVTPGAATTEAPAAPGSVVAHAVDGSDIQVGWTAGDASADGFLIEASSDRGANWTPVGAVRGDTTAYLAQRLCGNLSYMFRVAPFNAAGLGKPAVSPAATAGSDYGEGWYRVAFGDADNPGALTKAFKITDGWIQATSEADAVRQALTGSFTSSATHTTYTFPNSGAYFYTPDLWLPDGSNLGPALVIDDQFGARPTSGFPDTYVPLSVTRYSLLVITDTMPSSDAPAGQLDAGYFVTADTISLSSEFRATVTWSDGAISPATIVQTDVDHFSVFVKGVPAGDDLNNFTLSVVHLPTGVCYWRTTGEAPPGPLRPAQAIIFVPCRMTQQLPTGWPSATAPALDNALNPLPAQTGATPIRSPGPGEAASVAAEEVGKAALSPTSNEATGPSSQTYSSGPAIRLADDLGAQPAAAPDVEAPQPAGADQPTGAGDTSEPALPAGAGNTHEPGPVAPPATQPHRFGQVAIAEESSAPGGRVGVLAHHLRGRWASTPSLQEHFPERWAVPTLRESPTLAVCAAVLVPLGLRPARRRRRREKGDGADGGGGGGEGVKG